MGSVGDDYVCPWCGRAGNGGYAPDPIGYPICTEGRYSCLWTKYVDQGFDRTHCRAAQLRVIFCCLLSPGKATPPAHPFTPSVTAAGLLAALPVVAAFL